MIVNKFVMKVIVNNVKLKYNKLVCVEKSLKNYFVDKHLNVNKFVINH